MTKFIQLHALTVYAPSNLNRDDTGRPKTAKFGGAERLRISSQALKRAIRTSDAFKTRVGDNRGERTARVGEVLKIALVNGGLEFDVAAAIAKTISSLVGTPDNTAKDGKVINKELYFMPPQERLALLAMANEVLTNKDLASELAAAAGAVDDEQEDDDAEDEDNSKKKGKKSKKKGLAKARAAELRSKVLFTTDTAVDIAMFGRMLAGAPDFNREAAVQVAHAITTHKVEVEDDFYTAVDDLKKSSEDAGAGFIGELGFGSGVFYIYACIDRDLLKRNLGDDEALTETAIAAFVEGLAKSSPTGKQASFASRAHASYLRVEKGTQQPRQLSAAFLKPVRGDDLLKESVSSLEKLADDMTKAYGSCFDTSATMNVVAGQGSLADIISFATKE